MDLEQLGSLILENCPEMLRKSWKPVIAKEPSTNVYVTKFGGSNPFRRTNFTWPKCLDKECGKQMSFICQINLADLPDRVKSHIGKDSGLFQCFWCTAMFDCDKWASSGEEKIGNIRFIPRSEMIPSLQTLAAISLFENKVNTDKLPDALKRFVEETNEQFDGSNLRREERVGEEKQVELWKESRVQEIPVFDEITNNNKISEVVLAVPGITEDVLEEVFEDLEYDSDDDTAVSPPLRGVKIGGYVSWFEQEMSYSSCPDCDMEMDVTFLQLEYAREVLPYGWDSGASAITLCPGCGKPNLYWRNNP